MDRRNFVFGGISGLALTGAAPAWACQFPNRDQCDPVPENNFGAGSRTNPDYQVDLCLPDEIQRAITLNNGSFEWTLRLLTLNGGGGVRWQTAHVLRNEACRRQWVFHGTYAAVYVTCDEYTGWMTTGAITRSGQPTFQYINWNLDYRALDRQWPV